MTARVELIQHPSWDDVAEHLVWGWLYVDDEGPLASNPNAYEDRGDCLAHCAKVLGGYVSEGRIVRYVSRPDAMTAPDIIPVVCAP